MIIRSQTLGALLFSSLFLSINRILLYPFFGNSASFVSAYPISIFSFSFLILLPTSLLPLSLIFYASALSVYSLFSSPVIDVFISYFETLAPYLLICCLPELLGSSLLPIKSSFSVRQFIGLLYIILIVGFLMQFFGISLPMFLQISTYSTDTYISALSSYRFTSFVGTSGPFAISLAYLTIAMVLLYKNLSFYILLASFAVQFLSLSRSGLLVLLFFLFAYLIFELVQSRVFRLRYTQNILILLSIVILFSLIFYFFFSNLGLVLNIFDRVAGVFSIQADGGNVGRIERMTHALTVVKDQSFLSYLFGDGTGKTSRFLGGEQGESQLIKIFIEWGVFGLLIVTYSFYHAICKSFITPASLALFLTLMWNLVWIQALTSPPIFVSMSLCVVALRCKRLQVIDDQ